MIVYIIGPISGREDFNRSEFERARSIIERHGCRAIIPLDLTQDIQGHRCPAYLWTVAMCRCLDALEGADAIIALPGWKNSRGANIEIRKAKQMGLSISYWR